jgi:hypothetical protein
MANVIFCPWCSFPGGQLRTAKNGRPYYECQGCKLRAFCNTQAALDGMKYIIRRSSEWARERLAAATQSANAAASESARIVLEELNRETAEVSGGPTAEVTA